MILDPYVSMSLLQVFQVHLYELHPLERDYALFATFSHS